jgi:menaquinone-specific isochorismate synthase
VSGFGEARLVLPRFEFRHDGRQGQMALFAMREDADTGELEQLVGRLLDWRARAQSELPPLPPPPRLVDRAAGAGLRDRILAAIESVTQDRMAKVVIAQTEHLLLDPAPDAAVTLRRLHQGSPSATAFAFDTEAGCFLGASPERLVLRDQQHVVSEALAGSARWSSESDATALLRSAKDQSEHAFVVESIVQALEPLCTELRAPTSPVLRTLEHVAHLSTPIEGRLATAVHVLDLVERLHPTPAVGGSPTQAALEWIAAHEPHPRGWYSGPVGWADTAGNGDFVVALRSGHLQGHAAMLHAGAGVVRDSVAEAELAEIDLKLESFRAALGVGTR